MIPFIYLLLLHYYFHIFFIGGRARKIFFSWEILDKNRMKKTELIKEEKPLKLALKKQKILIYVEGVTLSKIN